MKYVEYCVRVNGWVCYSTFSKSKADAKRVELEEKYPQNVYDIVTNVYGEVEYQRYFVCGEI